MAGAVWVLWDLGEDYRGVGEAGTRGKEEPSGRRIASKGPREGGGGRRKPGVGFVRSNSLTPYPALGRSQWPPLSR